jgi:hypothetical protein
MTLTRKAVEKKWNSSPSWTRDEWISEVVFNQPVREVPWIGKYVKNEKTGNEYILPSYSTDITAAWEVVEKLRIAVTPQSIGAPEELSYMAEYENAPYVELKRVFAKTAPEAICKCALLAVLNL